MLIWVLRLQDIQATWMSIVVLSLPIIALLQHVCLCVSNCISVYYAPG